MPSTVRYCSNTQILYISHRGQVTMDDRRQLMLEIKAMELNNLLLLVDVRELEAMLKHDESTELMEATQQSQLRFQKIAVLHQERFNPYIVLASLGTLSGYNVEDFISLDEAEAWLQQPL